MIFHLTFMDGMKIISLDVLIAFIVFLMNIVL